MKTSQSDTLCCDSLQASTLTKFDISRPAVSYKNKLKNKIMSKKVQCESNRKQITSIL
jgi:hypothetical protein